MNAKFEAIDDRDLATYDELKPKLVREISDQLFDRYKEEYVRFGDQARSYCEEDIAFHLQYLRPCLASGYLTPYVEYLSWLAEVFVSRHIPTEHIDETIEMMGRYFVEHFPAKGRQIAGALSYCVREYGQPKEITQKPDSNDPLVTSLEAALLKGDVNRSSKVLEQYQREGHTFFEIATGLIEPAMRDIGDQWKQNKITVAQEHLATATVTTTVTKWLATQQYAEPNNKHVVLACVEGNHHVLGLMLLADGLELLGWEVSLLGANTPSRDLIRFVADLQPDVVGLSVAFPYQLPKARQALDGIKTACGPNCPDLIVGGSAVDQYPELFKLIGAHTASSNLLSAFSD